MASIFDRTKLTPAQLRTVADRRLGDAEALRDTRQNARANGAIYLAGFVLECLLKAKLLEKHPWLRSAAFPHGRPAGEQRLWSLCYRSHDLDDLLAELPEVTDRMRKHHQKGMPSQVAALKEWCGRWTIFARYSPHQVTMREADAFLTQIKELKPWLK